MHNQAVEAQLQSVVAKLEGIGPRGQPHLVGAQTDILHIKRDGSAGGVDEGGCEVAWVLRGRHRVLNLQPLDVARLERDILRVSNGESDDIRYHVDVIATARLHATT